MRICKHSTIIFFLLIFLISIWPKISSADQTIIGDSTYNNQPDYFCFFNQSMDFVCSLQKPAHESIVGELTVEKNGNRVFLSTPGGLNLSADDYKFLIIRVKSQVEGPYFRLNVFRRNEGGFPAEDFQPFIPLSQTWKTFYFPLNQSTFWRNIIDRIVFEIEEEDLIIDTIKIVKAQPSLYFKSIFQNLTVFTTVKGYGINFLLSRNIFGAPLIQYIYFFTLCIFLPFFILKFFNKTLRKKWSIVLLFIFLFFWIISESIFLIQNFKLLKRDIDELGGRSTLEGQQIFVNRYMVFDNAPNYYRQVAADFYPFLERAKDKLSVQDRVYIQTMHPGLQIRVMYYLADEIICVDQPEKANFILVYDEKLPEYQGFMPYFEYLPAGQAGPSQQEGFYKMILVKSQ